MVNKTALSVLERYWDGKLEVDPTAIARDAGVEVTTDFDFIEASGKFEFKNGKPVITYNMHESPLRQRFTIAHELGHFFLDHGPSFRDQVENFSTHIYDPKEVAANRFAAELLVPAAAVNFLIKKIEITDFEKLADVFKVSQVAKKIRLRNLGWL